jgi:hypothetical protein
LLSFVQERTQLYEIFILSIVDTLRIYAFERRESSIPPAGPRGSLRSDGARARDKSVHGRIDLQAKRQAIPMYRVAGHFLGGAAAVTARLILVLAVPIVAANVRADVGELPTSVLAAMRLNGTVDIAALIWSLLKRPCDLPTLMRLALDARAARATLLRGRELLDSSLCMGDFIAPGLQDGFFNRPPSCGGESRAQLLLRSRACGLE